MFRKKCEELRSTLAWALTMIIDVNNDVNNDDNNDDTNDDCSDDNTNSTDIRTSATWEWTPTTAGWATGARTRAWGDALPSQVS